MKTWRPILALSMNKGPPPPPAPKVNTYSLNPSCKDCKWSVQNGKICTAFSFNKDDPIWYTAERVRSNVELCGPDGFYFKKKIEFEDFVPFKIE